MTHPLTNLGADALREKRPLHWRETLAKLRKDIVRVAGRLREVSRDDTLPGFLFQHLLLTLRFSTGRYRGLAPAIPKLLTRYTRSYLDLSLSTPARRNVFLFHHALILERFQDRTIRDLATDKIDIWRCRIEGADYKICMRMDRSVYGEGDLVLEYFEDQVCLFDLSFSFAPGEALATDAASVLLVSRLQGRPDRFDSIRRATKACGDIFPGHVLLAAAEGVAAALSTRTLCGVGGDQQVSSRWGFGRFNYDSFWMELIEERRNGRYSSVLPIPRKPIADVSKAHRRRTKRKRLFKDAVAAQTRDTLASHLRAAPPERAR